MRVSRTYGGNHFKGEELDKPLLLTIDETSSKEFDDGKEKLIVSFREDDHTLVLNMTNAQTIAELYGDETDDWTGEKIVIYRDKTNFAGKRVDCIRVRAPKTKADTKPVRHREEPVTAKVAPMTQKEADEDPVTDDDDTPF
jgi:hypothetical protein